MDFEQAPELTALAAEAAALAAEWSATTAFPEDSWIVGASTASIYRTLEGQAV